MKGKNLQRQEKIQLNNQKVRMLEVALLILIIIEIIIGAITAYYIINVEPKKILKNEPTDVIMETFWERVPLERQIEIDLDLKVAELKEKEKRENKNNLTYVICKETLDIPQYIAEGTKKEEISKEEIIQEKIQDERIAFPEATDDYTELELNMSAYCKCIQCCGKSDGITASNVSATVWHTVAAPKEWPIGTKIYIPALADKPNGGWFVVEDRGGSIKDNKIDIFFDSHETAKVFGRKHLAGRVYFPKT